jgi:hypothetical protein
METAERPSPARDPDTKRHDVLVAVVGKRVDPPVINLALADAVGNVLARAGFSIVTGGRGGIMAAVAEGARRHGGRVIAILPGDEDCTGPADVVIRTGLPVTVRNVITASTCAAMVALPGSHGTWQEMAVALDREVPVFTVGGHTAVLPGTVEVAICDLVSALDAVLTSSSRASPAATPA